MPELWPRDERRFPRDRSFREIVDGARDPSMRMRDAAAGGGLNFAQSVRVFRLLPPRPMLFGTAIAVLGFCSSLYCGIAYLHYRHLAGAEQAAAEKAERANADLQQAFDRLREDLAGAGARRAPAGDGANPPPAVSKQNKPGPVAQLTSALGSPDLQIVDVQSARLAGLASEDATRRSAGYLQRVWTRIGIEETQEKLGEMSAEFDAVIGERDQLRERVKELEQTLSLLQPGQGPRQAAKGSPANSAGTSAGKAAAPAIAFPGSGAIAPVSEQSHAAVKNFTAPGSAPDYFSNEDGAILGIPSAGRQHR